MLPLHYRKTLSAKLKKIACVVAYIALVSLPCLSDKRTGVGVEVLAGTIYPLGGFGGGFSVRFRRIPLASSLLCLYFHRQQWSLKITTDYWLKNQQLNTSSSAYELYWFAGIGLWTNFAVYNANAVSADQRGFGGGIGMRLPLGGCVFAFAHRIEPYIQLSPEFGVAFYPASFERRAVAVWALPVSGGCRFWF